MMPVDASKREGRPGTTFHKTYQELMAMIEDLPVATALSTAAAFKCPVCTVIHPGIRYNHQARQPFCSPECLNQRRLERMQ